MTSKGLVHVVDDEESIRRSLDFLLRADGYRVECWHDGHAFLEVGHMAGRACVLLDLHMPGLDGLEVQELMAAKALDFPVIVLTGHGDISLAVRAMKAGAIDFLEKPFDREALLASIALAFRQLDDTQRSDDPTGWAGLQIGKLTEREREVLEGLACGYPNKTIAYDLGISVRTVDVYRAHVMSKLDVTNFAGALRIAFAAGMGSEPHWRAEHRSHSRS